MPNLWCYKENIKKAFCTDRLVFGKVFWKKEALKKRVFKHGKCIIARYFKLLENLKKTIPHQELIYIPSQRTILTLAHIFSLTKYNK